MSREGRSATDNHSGTSMDTHATGHAAPRSCPRFAVTRRQKRSSGVADVDACCTSRRAPQQRKRQAAVLHCEYSMSNADARYGPSLKKGSQMSRMASCCLSGPVCPYPAVGEADPDQLRARLSDQIRRPACCQGAVRNPLAVQNTLSQAAAAVRPTSTYPECSMLLR